MSQKKEEKDKSLAAVEKDVSTNSKGEGLEGKMDSADDKSKGELDKCVFCGSCVFTSLWCSKSTE